MCPRLVENSLVHAGEMRSEVFRNRYERPQVTVHVKAVSLKPEELIFNASGKRPNRRPGFQLSSMQADNRLYHCVQFDALLYQAIAQIDLAADVLAIQRLEIHLSSDRSTDTAKICKASGVVGIGFLPPDRKELGGPADLNNIDWKTHRLEFAHHVGSNASFDDDTLNSFYAEWPQDILDLTSMSFPLSFEENFSVLIYQAYCCFGYACIEANPIFPHRHTLSQ